MTSLLLNADRVTSFFAQWNALIASPIEDATNKNVDVIVVLSGETRETSVNERSGALLAHILPNKGAFIPGVLAAFKRGATPAEGQLLIVSAPETTISVPVKSEGVEQAQCQAITAETVADSNELKAFLAGSSVGIAAKEVDLQIGAFAKSAQSFISGLGAVETSPTIGQSLRVKDKEARKMVTKAGALLARIWNVAVLPDLDNLPATTADYKEGKHPTKAHFSTEKIGLCNNATQVAGLEKLTDSATFKSTLMFVAQSTGNYNTSMKTTVGGPEAITGDCVIISGALSCEGYSAFLARTYLFPDRCGEGIVAEYNFCYAVMEKLVELARPGHQYSVVAEQVMAFAKETNAQLAERVDATDFGCNTGLTILAGKEYITASNTTSVFQLDSSVVLRVSLNNLAASAPLPVKKEEVEVKQEDGTVEERKPTIPTNAIHIADTYILSAEASVVVTAKVSKDLNDCVRRLEELHEESDFEEEAPQEIDYIVPTTRQKTGTVSGVSNEVRRNAAIKEVLAERHAAWVATDGKSNKGGEAEDITGTELGKVVNGDFGPYQTQQPALHVDMKNKVVYLPIAGNIVPFHVATITKAEVKSLGAMHTLTVNFAAALETNVAYRMNRTKIFLKEAVVNSGDLESIRMCQTRIVELIGAIKTADAQRKASFGVAKGGQLQMNRRGNLPKLNKVKCRPPPVAGKHGCPGDLEAHDNGFRFAYVGGEPLTIFYDNIKHCIFQPANNDPATVFHLTLKQPIMVAKKKCDEIQFAAEVVDQSEAMRNTNRTHEEEVLADQREEERIMKTNAEFAAFCKKLDGANKVVTAWNLSISIPMKNFNFTGNTGRAMVKFKANKDVLFAVNEWPFWTQNFKEVEVISLERVFPGMQNFDLKCIHKGYRKTTEVSNIPAEHIEDIKNMLSIARSLFFESASPLNWNQLLRVIRDDADWEPYGPHGWSTYMNEDDDDEDEGGDSDDSGSDSDESSGSDDSDDSDSSWADEVSSSALSTASSDSESWDAAERKAEEDDRRRGRGLDDENDAPKRKKARTESHPTSNTRGAAPRSAPSIKGAQIKGAPGAPMGVKRPGMPQPRMPPPRH